MTKLRPSWSKWLARAAACACGLLLLLQAPSPVWATGKKTGGKPPVKKLVKLEAKKVSKGKVSAKSAPKLLSQVETGVVDILDYDVPGLRGTASFYGRGFHGRKTSTGERFDQREFTAASNHFPLNTLVAVQRMDNSRCAIVKVNDRMHARHRRRIIDVSTGVAEYLDMIRTGVVLVRVAPILGRKAHGEEACRAAFEPLPECTSCRIDAVSEPLRVTPRLPAFGSQEDIR